MRDVPAYRNVTGRSGLGSRAGALAAVVALLAVLGAWYHGHGHLPGARRVGFTPGPFVARTYHLNGPTSITAGGFMNLTGTLPPGVSGVIVLEARWGAGRWQTLGTTQSVNGGYRLHYQLAEPGIVDLRVGLPNGDYATTVVTVSPAASAGSSPVT